MDELTALCRRLLGEEDAAARCAAQARATFGRTPQFAAALQECRSARPQLPTAASAASAGGGDPSAGSSPPAPPGAGLRAAVAGELAAAASTVPERQQEALALRDVAGLSHELVGEVLAIEPAAATALLARARLSFRSGLRGEAAAEDACPERDRALRTITLRLDSESVPDADDWLIEHLGHCPGCRRAHASLLEAAACYRGWPSPDTELASGDVALPAAR